MMADGIANDATPNSRPPRHTLRGTWLARHWPYVVAVVAVLAALCLAPTIVAKQSLGRELARLRAAGEPVTLADLEPAKSRESVAATALYRQAFAGLQDRSEGEKLGLFVNPRVAKSHRRPVPGLPEVAAIVVRRQREVELLERAFRMKGPYLPVNGRKGSPETIAVRMAMYGAVGFLEAAAEINARLGRSDEALRDLALVACVPQRVVDAPMSLDQLVKRSAMDMAARRLPSVLAAAPPSEEEARAFYDAVRRVDLVASCARSVRVERVQTVVEFERAREVGEAALDDLVGNQHGAEAYLPRGARWWPARTLVLGPLVDFDEACYLRVMRQVTGIMGLPPRRGRLEWRRLQRSLKGVIPEYAVKTNQLVWEVSHSLDDRDATAAIAGLMQAAMALRVYQIKHGAYPASLAELANSGGLAIPDDPFSGRPFSYRRLGAGYLISGSVRGQALHMTR